MANNRMYLVCPRCPNAKCPMIAKYYPSTGWYSHPDGLEKRLDEFFEEHRHDSQWGNGFVVEYEIEPDGHADDPLSGTYRVSRTEPFPRNV